MADNPGYPYYQDGQVVIYHADCRDLLDRLEWDVTITDPPYGVGLKTRQARNKAAALSRVRVDGNPISRVRPVAARLGASNAIHAQAKVRGYASR